MNNIYNYFDRHANFSNGETVVNEPLHFQKYPEKTEEIEQTMDSSLTLCEQITTVKKKNFSFLWTITNFKEFMNREYEFTSPIFSENLTTGTSKWKMVMYPKNIYPEGVHVALRLYILSEVDKSISVMYTISLAGDNGIQHKLKIREKIFRHVLDFDECPVISNISLKQKAKLTGESLVIKCEFDLLECENLDDTACTSYEKASSVGMSHGNFYELFKESCEIQSCKNGEKNNIPSMNNSMNNLSYSKPYKKPSDSEKDVNSLMEKDGVLEIRSGEFGISNCKIKELEILSKDMEHLYYDTSEHDVIIYVDDGKRTAHKLILASRCDYFKKALMLQNENEINVPGINADTLDAVLYYLYTGKLEQMTENSALDLLKATKLLGLPGLEHMTTETFLSSRIRVNNVTNVFLMAKELKIESLKTSALKFMADNQDEIMKTEQWNKLMKDDPHSAGEVLLTVSYYRNKIPNNASSI